MVIFGPFLAEIEYFCNYKPLNVVFGANFIPYPKSLINRDFKANFGPSKFRSHGPGSSERGPKWSFLGEFQLKLHIFAIMSPSMWFLVLISYPTPKA